MYVCSMPLDKTNNNVVLTFIQWYLKVLVKGFSLKSKNIKCLIGCEKYKKCKEWRKQFGVVYPDPRKVLL